jgi:hypothetical protein
VGISQLSDHAQLELLEETPGRGQPADDHSTILSERDGEAAGEDDPPHKPTRDHITQLIGRIRVSFTTYIPLIGREKAGLAGT